MCVAVDTVALFSIQQSLQILILKIVICIFSKAFTKISKSIGTRNVRIHSKYPLNNIL